MTSDVFLNEKNSYISCKVKTKHRKNKSFPNENNCFNRRKLLQLKRTMNTQSYIIYALHIKSMPLYFQDPKNSLQLESILRQLLN